MNHWNSILRESKSFFKDVSTNVRWACSPSTPQMLQRWPFRPMTRTSRGPPGKQHNTSKDKARDCLVQGIPTVLCLPCCPSDYSLIYRYERYQRTWASHQGSPWRSFEGEIINVIVYLIVGLNHLVTARGQLAGVWQCASGAAASLCRAHCTSVWRAWDLDKQSHEQRELPVALTRGLSGEKAALGHPKEAPEWLFR